MPLKVNIDEADRFFTNADKLFKVKVYKADGVTPENVAGWALSWMMKRRPTDLDSAALVTKTTVSGITITGTYNADPALNTQEVQWTVTDEDTAAVKAGFYVHELKRTDVGSETPLCEGIVVLQQSAHRS